MSVVSRVIAGCFALAAFAVAVVAGVAGSNPPTVVLGRALMAMLLCYPVGFLVGLICQHAINEHLRANEAANPVPEAPVLDDELAGPGHEGGEEVLTV